MKSVCDAVWAYEEVCMVCGDMKNVCMVCEGDNTFCYWIVLHVSVEHDCSP